MEEPRVFEDADIPPHLLQHELIDLLQLGLQVKQAQWSLRRPEFKVVSKPEWSFGLLPLLGRRNRTGTGESKRSPRWTGLNPGRKPKSCVPPAEVAPRERGG
jgi:hypothetical protein